MTFHTPVRRAPVPAPSLADLAARAVEAGREAAAIAHEVGAGTNLSECRRVAVQLEALADRRPFEACDDALVAALGAIARDLEREREGTRRAVVDHDHDEHGTRYDVVGEVPAFSPRGERLLEARRLLEECRSLRDRVLDRVAAERAVRGLLAGDEPTGVERRSHGWGELRPCVIATAAMAGGPAPRPPVPRGPGPRSAPRPAAPVPPPVPQGARPTRELRAARTSVARSGPRRSSPASPWSDHHAPHRYAPPCRLHLPRLHGRGVHRRRPGPARRLVRARQPPRRRLRRGTGPRTSTPRPTS